MKRVFLWLGLLALAGALPNVRSGLAQEAEAPAAPEAAPAGEPGAEAALGDGTAFAVENIRLDVKAETVEAARNAAFREAPRRAWPRLWARMTGQTVSEAPTMSDAALDAMIDAIEVERERFGAGRYIARLGVVFNRQRAGERLPLGARILQSRPLLLLPISTDAGAFGALEPDGEWFAAWENFSSGSSVIDYVRPQGSAADRILLTGWQARRDDRGLWRAALARYDADNVLVAEARIDRTYPGGPIGASFVARYGPNGAELARFRMRANGPQELSAMLAAAVKRMDGAYARALQDGRLGADDERSVTLDPIAAAPEQLDDGRVAASSIAASVVTPTAGAWTAFNDVLAGAPHVTGVTLQTLDVGGTSRVRITHSGPLAQLRYALDQRGLRLEPGEAGYRLRRRIEGEPPLPEPGAEPVERGASAVPAPAPVEAEDDRADAPQSLLPGDAGQ